MLDNGLTLIVHEDHKAPIVAINMWYHVGSRNETPGKTGYAHLFEHLMFQGSENSEGEFLEQLEKIGATTLNGTTWFDRTNYYQTVPVNALDRVLFLESDRMGAHAGAQSIRPFWMNNAVLYRTKNARVIINPMQKSGPN